jgi:hypothetical protein
MEERLDLRTDEGRRNLASYLPEFDGQRYDVEADTFVALLEQLSDFLGRPEWFAYHYGVVMLGTRTKHYGPLTLRSLLRLSLQLACSPKTAPSDMRV